MSQTFTYFIRLRIVVYFGRDLTILRPYGPFTKEYCNTIEELTYVGTFKIFCIPTNNGFDCLFSESCLIWLLK